MRILFAGLLLIPALSSFAQPSCSITFSRNIICLGDPVIFTVNYSGNLRPDSIRWDFGDNSSDTIKSLTHKYSATGNYSPSVILSFPDGTSCTTSVNNIVVVPLPVAKFSVTTSDSQCISPNYFCFLDSSHSLPGQAPIVSRWLNYGDGDADLSTPVSIKNLCHKYLQVNNFTVTLEVTDSNGCTNRQTIDNAASVFDDLQISFRDSVILGHCDVTAVYFFNTSGVLPSFVRKFKWIFDDGTFDSVNWQQTRHDYKAGGTYHPKLIVVTEAGCTDSVESLIMVSELVLDITYNQQQQCLTGNNFIFTNPFMPFARLTWTFGDGHGDTGSVVRHTYRHCGTYQITLRIQLPNGCDTLSIDSVEVFGPEAIIEDTLAVLNKYQCEVKDTVKFTDPNPYASHHCKSNDVTRIWNFADPFAPQCTTDIKNGINVGINCNYSKDSLRVWHWYTPGKEQCYYPTLFLQDNNTGCVSKATTTIVLMKPDARWLTVGGLQCLENNLLRELNLKFSHPCGDEIMWINYDSACDKNNWVKTDLGDSVLYKSTCDPNGFVTVGLIIKIADCYDTVWYHHMLHFPKVSAAAIITPTYGCAPLTVTASLKDSIQKNIKDVIWEWGDNTSTVINLLPTDTVIHSQTHTYAVEKGYEIVVKVHGTGGCDSFTVHSIAVGTIRKLSADSLVCLGDTIKFYDFVRYYQGGHPKGYDPINYWDSTNVPEVLSWDFGDGAGFSTQGSEPEHVYNQQGIYNVKMAVNDKGGCRDTLSKKVKVLDVKAGFKTDSLLICPQFVQFYDSSFTGDTSSTASRDTVISWYWDFGDGKTPSVLKNPYHVYTSFGTFLVKLTVINSRGCISTIMKPLIIKGPEPKFRIDGDSMGCVPFTVTFENLSKDVTSWIWKFGDNTQSNASTSKVVHTYMNPGIYTIFLYGQDSLTNPVTGQKTYCASEFPDTTSPFVKLIKVYVLPRPPVNTIYKDPACVGENVVFINSSDPKYTDFRWYFSDGDTITSTAPAHASRVFDTAGTYTLHYKPVYIPAANDLLCPDSTTKTIKITDVVADFDIDLNGMPVIKFNNMSSSNAVRYQWNFGQPASGAKNISTLRDPLHDYVNDTNEMNVCLTAFNKEECVDIVCKPVRNTYFRLIKVYNVFTPDDDNFNDAFDIEIIGEESYHLNIYNRWGEQVFEGLQDGEGNDGINWDGTNIFTGKPCAQGVYYYVFSYKFREEEPKTIHGSVTLLGRE